MNTKKEMLSIRIPSSINKKFTEVVKEMGVTKSQFVLSYINEVIKNK